MTTDYDYINEYIAMNEPDGTRSIVKLIEEANSNGYKDMTNKEIDKLITYKENQAIKSKIIETELQHQKEMAEIMCNHFEEQKRIAKERFNAVINSTPTFKTIADMEVNNE